jgi:mono/diheme cytochrome c family protein
MSLAVTIVERREEQVRGRSDLVTLVSSLHFGRPVVRCSALLTLVLVVGGASRAMAAEAPPDPGAVLFSERCSTCHNIGGGPKVGPDLLGVVTRRQKTWFAKFVRGPSRLIDGGEPTAAALYKKFAPIKMPDQPLTDGEVDGVWAYFTSCNDKGGCQPVTLGSRWGTDGSEEEVARGLALFVGTRRLQRGGAPCFACHNVRGEAWMGGGTLGPDLTFAYARLGEKELAPVLSEMGTPVMHSVYGEAPLEEDEQFALKAYLADLARDGTTSRKDFDFFPLGLEGMAVVLGGFVIWRKSRAALARMGRPS